MAEGCPRVLVVAYSARMLAQTAKRAGFNPLAIDMFGDRDTLSCAEAFQKTASLAPSDLDEAITNLTRRYPVEGVVYGSGFECFSDSLELLNKRFILWGNPPGLFRGLHDKSMFFALLDALGIPHPEVSFKQPEHTGGWLIKPMQGQGGAGIYRYHGSKGIRKDVYWQKFQQGEPHSVLFLADGKHSQIIGFNRQWTENLGEKSEFVFSGVMNCTGLDGRQKAKIVKWLDILVPATSIKGLNSLDFIQCGEGIYALEINPRPPASMQLYSADLFIRHLNACRGELSRYDPGQPGTTAYQVVYARQDVVIPDDFQWPLGSHDLPLANSRISAGQPICSMIMRDQNPNKLFKRLKTQQASIINALDRLQTHGI